MAMFYNTNRRPQETIVYTLQPPRPWNLTQRAVQFWADNALQSTRRPRPQLSCPPITTDYAHCQYRLTCLRLELTIQGLQWLRDQRTFMSTFFTWLITSQFSRVNQDTIFPRRCAHLRRPYKPWSMHSYSIVHRNQRCEKTSLHVNAWLV